MKITKAVITAAGRNQHLLPLQTLVDRDGDAKSALGIALEEAVSAGVERICVVVCPGDAEAYARAAGSLGGRLVFVEQGTPRGYGHALLCAREFTGGDPFLHMVSDHLFLSSGAKRCAQQLVEAAVAENCSVSAVQATRENLLPHYGVVGGRRMPEGGGLYLVERVCEKPTPTQAEQELIVPGLRAGHYLCFFGLHVLTPAVMEILERQLAAAGKAGTISLSGALNELAARERYLALEIQGRRFNLELKYGLFLAQLAMALDGRDRTEVLAQMLELMAVREQTGRGAQS